MMTLQSWRTDTSRFMSDRKNELILDIDILLGEYHTPGKTDVQKQKLLILMLYYCTEWLVSKGEKANSWRRPYVQLLVDDIETELRSPSMMQATAQRIGGPGVQLKEDPIEVLQPRNGAKFGLGSGEGKSGLQFSRSSAVRAENFVNGFAVPRNQNSRNAYVAQLANSPINDYVDSLKILAVGNATGKIERNLEYLTKQERMGSRLSQWPDQRFHRGGADHPYSTTMNTDTGNVREKDLYAMDRMELIFAKPKAAQNGVFSSFLVYVRQGRALRRRDPFGQWDNQLYLQRKRSLPAKYPGPVELRASPAKKVRRESKRRQGRGSQYKARLGLRDTVSCLPGNSPLRNRATVAEIAQDARRQ
jgi:hypothetical protein